VIVELKRYEKNIVNCQDSSVKPTHFRKYPPIRPQKSA
jgi:hypothetical protein